LKEGRPHRVAVGSDFFSGWVTQIDEWIDAGGAVAKGGLDRCADAQRRTLCERQPTSSKNDCSKRTFPCLTSHDAPWPSALCALSARSAFTQTVLAKEALPCRTLSENLAHLACRSDFSSNSHEPGIRLSRLSATVSIGVLVAINGRPKIGTVFAECARAG
jgi:hypothetical protein